MEWLREEHYPVLGAGKKIFMNISQIGSCDQADLNLTSDIWLTYPLSMYAIVFILVYAVTGNKTKNHLPVLKI